MKKILKTTLMLPMIALLAVSAEAASVEEILAAMPAETTEAQAARMGELIALGPEAIQDVCAMLVPMGAGDDLAARYAVSGLAKHCTRPGTAADQATVAAALANALNVETETEVRAFLLQQLEFCGTKAEGAAIAPLLNDPELVEPAKAALAAIGVGAAPAVMHAAAPEAPAEMHDESDFESIFNGRNLRGWRGDRDSYGVVDGAIVWQEGGGNLYTRKAYDNFVLRFEFKLTPGANNGIGIRWPGDGEPAYTGMEIQVLDNTADQYKALEPYQYHGSVYGIAPAKRGFLKPVGEWNEQEIIADGRHIKVTLNGTVIVDVNLDEATASGTMDGKDHPGLKRTEGHIAFSGHGSVVSFRNLRVKEL
jgi:hypothetical protein